MVFEVEKVKMISYWNTAFLNKHSSDKFFIRRKVLGDKKYIFSILLHISYRYYLLTTMLASVQNTNSLSISNRKDNLLKDQTRLAYFGSKTGQMKNIRDK